MSAHRYWRVYRLATRDNAGLALSAFQLLDATTRVDAAATLTASTPPTAGTLANLQDASTATDASWPAAAVRGLSLIWDFVGTPKSVNDLALGATDDPTKLPITATTAWSDNGNAWTDDYTFEYIVAPAARTMTTSIGGGGAETDSVLLHFDGADGSTVFAEETGKTVTKTGTVMVSTAQSKFGGASGAFTGAGYLKVPHAAIGAGDFAVVASFRASGAGGSQAIFDLAGPVWEVFLAGGSGLSFYSPQTGTLPTGISSVAGAWHTCSLERKGGVVKISLNGSVVLTCNLGIAIAAGNLHIGADDRGNEMFFGHIDEVLMVVGDTALEKDNYAVPSAPFALSQSKITRSTRSGRSPVFGPLAMPSAAYTGPVTSRDLSHMARLRGDFQLGTLGQGTGRIRNTVKTRTGPAAAPVDVPVAERVRLIRERDGLVIREQWSDPATGAYDFQHIDELEVYTVISYDHTHDKRAVIADNLSLANGIVERMP